MANLKEIRSRISSVNSTMKITAAMKLVSGSKLKKAQDAIVAMRPYSSKLTELLQNLSATLNDNVGSVFSEKREVKKVLLVAITSNRGLCGTFNSSIIKTTRNIIIDKYKNVEVDLFTIGKKGNDILSKEFNVISNINAIFDNITYAETSKIAQNLMDKFVAGDYDKIELIYNQFENAATQIIQIEQFLPIKSIENTENASLEYIFEPSKEQIVLELIPKSLKTQLYKALLDSNAAEHGARMTAMHKATDNAKELGDELKLTYNKARQASITNEILEIVSGADALSN